MFGNSQQTVLLSAINTKLDAINQSIAGLSRGQDKAATESTRRFDAIEPLLQEIKTAQLTARKNGNGTARAAAQTARKPAVAYPAGAGIGGAILYIVQHLLGG